MKSLVMEPAVPPEAAKCAQKSPAQTDRSRPVAAPAEAAWPPPLSRPVWGRPVPISCYWATTESVEASWTSEISADALSVRADEASPCETIS
jgi:hypothetical protein